MQNRPYLIALLGQPPLIVLHLGQIAVAPFDSRRSTLKDVDPVGRPRLPLCKDLWGEPLGNRMRVKRGADGLQGAVSANLLYGFGHVNLQNAATN